MEDLERAIALLEQDTELTEEEATELLTELEVADLEPRLSLVLYPTDSSVVYELEFTGVGRLHLVIKRVYTHRFAFLVKATPSGNRRIVHWAPLR